MKHAGQRHVVLPGQVGRHFNDPRQLVGVGRADADGRYAEAMAFGQLPGLVGQRVGEGVVIGVARGADARARDHLPVAHQSEFAGGTADVDAQDHARAWREPLKPYQAR